MNLKLDEDYLYLYNKTLVKNIENKLSQCMVAEGTRTTYLKNLQK